MSAQKKTLQSFLDCSGCFQERNKRTFGWCEICRVDQADIATVLSLPPEVLSLQVCATTPCLLHRFQEEKHSASFFWSPFVVLAGLSSQRSACLWLPSAGIKTMLYQGRLVQLLLCSPEITRTTIISHTYLEFSNNHTKYTEFIPVCLSD